MLFLSTGVGAWDFVNLTAMLVYNSASKVHIKQPITLNICPCVALIFQKYPSTSLNRTHHLLINGMV